MCVAMSRRTAEDSKTLFLIVRDDFASEKRGGVQLLEQKLYDQAKRRGLDVVTTSKSDIYSHLSTSFYSRFVVFIQTNGRLSAEYRIWAESLLNKGCEIVEENIFALASRYRPTHPKYTLALMSLDGALRYSYRCFWSGLKKTKTFLLLPNPDYFEPFHEAKANRPSPSFSFLRIGRPDPIKWSSFEVDFVTKLALQVPSVQFTLRLVEPPSCLETSTVVPNLKIERGDYQSNVSALYNSADCYIHHSAIGETFGNTISEASRSGVPVLYAADFDWDMAPQVRMDSRNLAWSSPGKLMKNSSAAFEKIKAMKESLKNVNPAETAEVWDFLGLILDLDKTISSRITPKAHEFLVHLIRMRSVATFRPSVLEIARGAVLEALRAIKNRRKIDQ
jgi:glycosyltransferase involved in cell wall biosynthesis